MPRYIEENEIYNLFNARGVAQLHVGDIDVLPRAEVKEVVHGRWVLERQPDGKPYCFHCSVCDDDFHHIGINTAYSYCPNCGAKMEERS